MPTVIRRAATVTLADRRRQVRRAVSWQMTTGMWSPPTDVSETETDYIVTLEVAGMREADFEVVLDNGLLLVTGQRPDVTERLAYHQMEIHFGKFSTAIALPGPVDLDAAAAEYKDGFLVIKLPKAKSTNVKIEG